MLSATAFVAQLGERRTSFAGSRVSLSPKALELHFSQLVSVEFTKNLHTRKISLSFTVFLMVVWQTVTLKLRLNIEINRADFVSWCMLYSYEDNKRHSRENDPVLRR